MKIRFLLFLAMVFGAGDLPSAHPESLTVYSARNEQLIRPLFKKFERETGIQIQAVTDKAGPLLQKLKAEGKKTTADVLFTVDAGNLYLAEQNGLLQPIESQTLKKNIPSHLRSSQGTWYGFSVRARTIVYSPKRVEKGDLSSYENLAEPKWKNRLCLRTSKKVYNQSLVATLIEAHGEKKTEKIVKGWVNNLAAPVFSSDTRLLKAIDSGQCDVGIVNTYYLGRLQKKHDRYKKSVQIFWPNQSGRGVHVNISGAGMVVHSKKKKTVTQLLNWMSQPTAQRILADGNLEYPVNPKVEPSELVQKWGEFQQNTVNLEVAGKRQRQAIRLMDRVGYK